MATGAETSLESDGEATPKNKTPQELNRFWTKEKEAADKRLRKYKTQGNKIVKRFLDDRVGGNSIDGAEGMRSVEGARLNLFHTNIVTQQSMLYGSTPKIEVSREHQDPDDDVARVASMLYQRILEADVASSGDDLSTTLKAALQDRLLPGFGTARVRYGIQTEKMPQIVATDSGVEVQELDQLIDERCKIEYVHWQDCLWGWARTWSEVPWFGYRSYLTNEEATERFGSKKAKMLQYKHQLPGAESKDQLDDKDLQNNVQKAEIWEFWDKITKRVYWWSMGLDLILDSMTDPLELEGFFPSPMPMVANPTTTLFVPRADFIIAQDLYNQVDELNSRIQTITRAVKVVGVYDKNAGGSVGRMLKEGVENDLIPVDNWALLAEKGGLAGVLDWFPVQDVVATLGTLRQLLGETIELLYQVTGMSDVLRGANTDQYTSDGTNQLKAKFGSIRVQALQDEFARFASDLDNLKAEVISKHFEEKTIVEQSNAQFLPKPDLPKVPDALKLMKSPEIKWRVNIRPESLAMVDYAQLKAERTEFLTAMATYIQSAVSAAKEMPGALPMLLEMMKWGMSGFKGANYLEGIMDEAIETAKNAPEKQEDDGQAEAAKAAQQQSQMDHQNEMEKIQAKASSDAQTQQQKHQAGMEQEMLDHRNKMTEEQSSHAMEMKKLREEFMADMKMVEQNLNADLQTERAQSAYAIEEEEVSHAMTMVEMGADHATNMQEKQEDAKVATRSNNPQTDADR